MDYEQFYKYLNSRGPDEIRDCLQNVTQLARKRSISIDFEGTSTTSTTEAPSKPERPQIAKKIWFQQALWNKFGSGVVAVTIKELAQKVGDLCCEERAIEYIADVNKLITEELIRSRSSMDESTIIALVRDTKISDVSVPESPIALPTETSSPSMLVDTNDCNDSSVGHTSDTDGSDLESASDTSEISEYSHQQFAPSASSAPPAKKRKRKIHKPPFQWTAAMDAAVKVAVAKHHHEGWDAVHQRLKFDVTRAQLVSHWNHHLKQLKHQQHQHDVQHQKKKPKTKPARAKAGPPWTVAQLALLAETVPKNTNEAHWSHFYQSWTPPNTDWTAVGKILERPAAQCRHKWMAVKPDQD